MYNKIKNIKLIKKFVFSKGLAIFDKIKGMINVKLICKENFKGLPIYVNLKASFAIGKKLKCDLNFESLSLW